MPGSSFFLFFPSSLPPATQKHLHSPGAWEILLQYSVSSCYNILGGQALKLWFCLFVCLFIEARLPVLPRLGLNS